MWNARVACITDKSRRGGHEPFASMDPTVRWRRVRSVILATHFFLLPTLGVPIVGSRFTAPRRSRQRVCPAINSIFTIIACATVRNVDSRRRSHVTWSRRRSHTDWSRRRSQTDWSRRRSHTGWSRRGSHGGSRGSGAAINSETEVPTWTTGVRTRDGELAVALKDRKCGTTMLLQYDHCRAVLRSFGFCNWNAEPLAAMVRVQHAALLLIIGEHLAALCVPEHGVRFRFPFPAGKGVVIAIDTVYSIVACATVRGDRISKRQVERKSLSSTGQVDTPSISSNERVRTHHKGFARWRAV